MRDHPSRMADIPLEDVYEYDASTNELIIRKTQDKPEQKTRQTNSEVISEKKTLSPRQKGENWKAKADDGAGETGARESHKKKQTNSRLANQTSARNIHLQPERNPTNSFPKLQIVKRNMRKAHSNQTNGPHRAMRCGKKRTCASTANGTHQ